MSAWVWPHFDAALGAALDEIFSRPFDHRLGRKAWDTGAIVATCQPDGA